MVYQPRLSPLATTSFDVSSPSLRNGGNSNNQDWLRRRQVGSYQDESSSFVDTLQSPLQARQTVIPRSQSTRITPLPPEQTQTSVASPPAENFSTRTSTTFQPQRQNSFIIQTPGQSIKRENESILTASTIRSTNVPSSQGTTQPFTPQQNSNTFQQSQLLGFSTTQSPLSQSSQTFNNSSTRTTNQNSSPYILSDPGKTVYSTGLSGRSIGQTESTTRPKQAESALVQTTPYPKPKQQPAFTNLPKNPPIPSLVLSNTTTSTTSNASFVPNAWFSDGTPVPVQVPVSRYRIAPYVTPTKFSERLVNVKGVPALLPPDPDPDEGIEY
ncbi:15850_t:CDS:2 [Acaulospora colombiana]|uniref:15850_t:CDS:1 n=1 Tax=Acaulospora colombiana TaxID=27376 RepID=A0ACA9KGL7_9GLOM|nr:15850_t:CDS:2 [Acaulospora colombiana]